MSILQDAVAGLRSVCIITVPGEGGCPDLHYVALVQGDQVLAPIGPGPLSETEAETESAVYAARMGWRVSHRDDPDYDDGRLIPEQERGGMDR